jgi:hypothetical protein
LGDWFLHLKQVPRARLTPAWLRQQKLLLDLLAGLTNHGSLHTQYYSRLPWQRVVKDFALPVHMSVFSAINSDYRLSWSTPHAYHP